MPFPTTFDALVKVALTCGYILTRHEDAHLIAIPWTDTACPDIDLVEKLFDEGGGYINGDPCKKLHGRKVWHIVLGDDLFVDVSVMPRIATEQQRLAKRHLLVARNQAIYDDFVYHDLTRGALSNKYNLSTFHLDGILDIMRMRRRRADTNNHLIRPGEDPLKRRVKNEQGHEAGYILVYPTTQAMGMLELKHTKTPPPVWTYREAQKEADRLNRTTPL